MVKLATSIAVSILVILLTAGIVRAQSGPTLPTELQVEVQRIIGSQIQAFRSEDHEKAFSFAAPSIQQIFGSTDRFIKMVKKGYGAIYGARSWSFGRGEVRGDALVQEVLIMGPQGRDWVALYTLRKQPDGSWRIAGVQMKQAELQST